MFRSHAQPNPAAARQKPKVFISYARHDLLFAKKLVAGLELRDVEILIDERDLPLAVEFKQELLGFIRQADSIVFIVSPASIASPWCAWEIEQVQLLNKRLAPVVLEPVADDKVPEGIRKINYVFFTGEDLGGAPFEARCDTLARALKMDVPWIKEHTRLGEQARRWEESGRSSAQLLRGAELQAAESWSARQPLEAPPLSGRHRSLIVASRNFATRWQRLTAGGSLAAAAIAIALSGFAFWAKGQADASAALAQQKELEAQASASDAKTNAEVAKENETRAISEQKKAAAERDAARRSESVILADQAVREIDAGAPKEGISRALKALPVDLQQPDRPFLPRAEFALARAALADRSVLTLVPGRDRANHAGYSSDGKHIASGSRDGLVKIWDAATGNELHTFNDDRKAVLALEFSPDGTLLAASYDAPASIVVRNVASGAVVADMTTGKSTAARLVFWKDNSKLASSNFSFDTKPRIWDLKTGRLIAILQGATAWDNLIHNLTLAPDQKTLTQTGSRWTVVWNTETLEPIFKDESALLELIGKDEQPSWTGFRTENGHLVVKGRTKVYEIDLDAKRTVRSWPYNKEWAAGVTDETALSPSNDTIAMVIANREPALFNFDDGSNKRVLVGHTAPISAMAFRPDGAQFATASQDQSVRLWDSASGRPLAVLRDHAGIPRGLAYSPDSRSLLTWDDRALHVYDVRPDEQRLGIAGPGPDWTIQRINETGTRGIYARKTKPGDVNETGLALWDLTGNRSVAALKPPAGYTFDLSKAEFSSDGLTLAIEVGNARETAVQLIDADSGENGSLLDAPSVAGGSFQNVSLSEDGGVAALAASNYEDKGRGSQTQAVVWKTASRTKRLQIDVAGGNGAPVLSPDGSKFALVVAAPSGTYEEFDISLWDVASGVKLLQLRRKLDGARDLRFVAGSERLLVSGGAAPPLLFDTATGRQLNGQGRQKFSAKQAYVSQDGSRLTVTRENGPATVWNSQDGRLIATLPGRNRHVYWVRPSLKGERLMTYAQTRESGSAADQLEIWDLATGEKQRLLRFDTIEAAEIGPAGRRAVVQNGANALSIYDAGLETPAREIQLATARRSIDFGASDDRMITSDDDGRVQIWDTETARAVGETFLADGTSPFAFLTAGEGVFGVHGADGNLRVVDSGDGRVLRSLLLPKNFESAQASRDHEVVAIAERGGIRIVSTASGEVIDRFERAPGVVEAIQTTEAAPVFFIHAPKGQSLLYDFKSRKILARIDTAANALLAGPNHNRLAVTRGPMLEVFDVATGDKTFSSDLGSNAVSLRGDPAGEAIAATTTGKRVLAFSLQDGRQFFAKGPLYRKPQWITFGRDSSRLAIYEEDGRGLTLWNTANDEIVTKFPIDWDALSTSGLSTDWRVRAGDDRIAVVNPDSVVEITSARDGNSVCCFSWDTYKIADVMFLSQGQRLLVVTDEGRLAVWNIDKGQTEKTHALGDAVPNYGHSWFISSAAGGTAAILGTTGRIHLFSNLSLETRKLFSGEEESGTSGAFSPDGTLLATVCKEGVLRVWNTSLGEVLLELRDPVAFKSDDAKVRFSVNGRSLIVESNYHEENSVIIRLPDTGESLIARSRRVVSQGQQAASGLVTANARLRLGVMMLSVSEDVRRRLGLETAGGALVSEVVPTSVAEAAGIRPGDVILEIDGRVIVETAEVAAAVKGKASGADLILKVARDGAVRQVRARFND